MDLKYHLFEWNFLRTANQLANKKTKRGILFVVDDQYYLTYSPWVEFGDLGCDEYLLNIKKTGLDPLLQKQLSLAQELEKIKAKRFLNHGDSKAIQSVVKLKMGADIDSCITVIEDYAKKNIRLRLDFNNLLTLLSFTKLLEKLSQTARDKIEYVEDPFPMKDNTDVGSFPVTIACDRNPWISPISIYKPAVDITPPTSDKYAIFSSYMGHDLGRLYCFLELMRVGDLSLYHGIDTPALFKEQVSLFNRDGDYCSLDTQGVEKMFCELRELEWMSL